MRHSWGFPIGRFFSCYKSLVSLVDQASVFRCHRLLISNELYGADGFSRREARVGIQSASTLTLDSVNHWSTESHDAKSPLMESIRGETMSVQSSYRKASATISTQPKFTPEIIWLRKLFLEISDSHSVIDRWQRLRSKPELSTSTSAVQVRHSEQLWSEMSFPIIQPWLRNFRG